MSETKIEIWDNTEKDKCIYSFVLKEGEYKKLSIRKNNPRRSVFINVWNHKIVVIYPKKESIGVGG